MRLIRCEQCERTEPIDKVSGWIEAKQDGSTGAWDFCSVACLAAWSLEAR